jgi:ketosteroid isomerase-like protein
VSQENVDVVLGLSEANNRRDWDAVFAAYAPDIEWEDCSGLWGDWGVARGHEGLREAWRRWFQVLGDVNWRIEGTPIDAGDDVVTTYQVHGRGRGSGVEVDQRITLLWTLRDGRVARVRAYLERAEALEVAGLSEESAKGR